MQSLIPQAKSDVENDLQLLREKAMVLDFLLEGIAEKEKHAMNNDMVELFHAKCERAEIERQIKIRESMMECCR